MKLDLLTIKKMLYIKELYSFIEDIKTAWKIPTSYITNKIVGPFSRS